MGGDTLYCFTIYDHPKDAPDCFVVRRWALRGNNSYPSRPSAPRRSSKHERRSLPGLVLMPRGPEDDPAIVETWM